VESGCTIQRSVNPEFQGHHTNEARYEAGIMPPRNSIAAYQKRSTLRTTVDSAKSV
jgi:hypothetical protein